MILLFVAVVGFQTLVSGTLASGSGLPCSQSLPTDILEAHHTTIEGNMSVKFKDEYALEINMYTMLVWVHSCEAKEILRSRFDRKSDIAMM